MKLDKIDKRLLAYIFHNFREPLTRIAKKCKISREQVEYRMKKYEKEGLIKKYLPIFDLSKLGYTKNYSIRLRLKKVSKQKINLIKSSQKNLVMIKLICHGQWDLILNVFSKTQNDFLEFLSELFEKFSTDLIDYGVYEPIETYYFPLKIFGKTHEEKSIKISMKETKDLSKKDIKIIKVLGENAKMKIVDIAGEVSENAETVKYRLKKLQQEIIIGYRVFLDLEKIGYSLSSILIKINDLSKNTMKRLLDYAKERGRIHAYSIGIGQSEVIFQIVYSSPAELREEINNIKKLFGDKILKYEIVNIDEELIPETFYTSFA